MTAPGWFAEAEEGARKAQFRQARSTYENRLALAVAAILGAAPDHVRALALARTAEPLPTLAVLDELDPRPRFQLRAGRVLRVHELGMSDLYRAFSRTPLARAYEELAEGCDPDDPRPLAMAFDWPGVEKYMCLHGGDLPAWARVDAAPAVAVPGRRVRTGDRAAVVLQLARPILGRDRLVLETVFSALGAYAEAPECSG